MPPPLTVTITSLGFSSRPPPAHQSLPGRSAPPYCSKAPGSAIRRRGHRAPLSAATERSRGWLDPGMCDRKQRGPTIARRAAARSSPPASTARRHSLNLEDPPIANRETERFIDRAFPGEDETVAWSNPTGVVHGNLQRLPSITRAAPEPVPRITARSGLANIPRSMRRPEDESLVAGRWTTRPSPAEPEPAYLADRHARGFRASASNAGMPGIAPGRHCLPRDRHPPESVPPLAHPQEPGNRLDEPLERQGARDWRSRLAPRRPSAGRTTSRWHRSSHVLMNSNSDLSSGSPPGRKSNAIS